LSHLEVFSITNTTKDGAGRVPLNICPFSTFVMGGVHMPTSSHANAANQGSDNSDSLSRNGTLFSEGKIRTYTHKFKI